MLAARYVPSSLPSLVIPGEMAQGRVHLARERCHKAVLTLIRRCYSHICARTGRMAGAFFVADAPSRLHPSRGTLQYRSRALPKAARAPAWHADGLCPMFLGPVHTRCRRDEPPIPCPSQRERAGFGPASHVYRRKYSSWELRPA